MCFPVSLWTQISLHVSLYIPLAFKVNLALLKFLSSKAVTACSSTSRNTINSESCYLGLSFCSGVWGQLGWVRAHLRWEIACLEAGVCGADPAAGPHTTWGSSRLDTGQNSAMLDITWCNSSYNIRLWV